MENITYLCNPSQPSFINSADSLAYQAIILEKYQRIAFVKNYQEGKTIQQLDFGMEFGKQCAIYTVQKLISDPENLNKIIHNYAHVISYLCDTEFIHSLYSLKNQIFQFIPSYCLEYKNDIMLKSVISQKIALIILTCVEGDPLKSKITIEILADYLIII